MSNQQDENDNRTVDNGLQNNKAQQTSGDESSSNNSSSEGVSVIANGALCTCPKSPGEQVGIKALSQSQVFVNGGTLLAVTTNDKTVASLKFKKCGNKSCAANITWQNAYADTQILGSLQILTMNSFGNCAEGGKIEFATCGQSERITPATTKDITGLKTQQLSEENPITPEDDTQSEISSDREINPPINLEDTERDSLEQPVIEVLKEGAGASSIIKSIVPVTFPQTKTRGTVKQPRNVSCTFKGAASGTYYWKVRSDDMSVLKEAQGAGQITIRFPKLGRYVIEAYKSTSFVNEGTTIEKIETNSDDFRNTLIIEVVENEITLKAQKTRCPINDTVNIKVESLFSTLDMDAGQISYQALSQGVPLADSTQAEITGNSQTATAKFKAKGSYVIHGTSSKGIKINPTESITVEALLVKQVTAKGEQKYKARNGEDFELKAILNYDTSENQKKIKWEVYYSETESGSQTKCYPLAEGVILNNKPPKELFSKVGFYSIYAFCGSSKSNSVKAVVEIGQPKFVSVQWKDLNGNNIQEVGKREAVYAHIRMEGVSGLDLTFEVYCIQTGKMIDQQYGNQLQSNTSVYTLRLSENEIKNLQEGYKLYIKPSIRNNNGISIINKDKAPKDYPITYTTKEKITSLAFYADKDCKQGIVSATYGNIIYARVLTRNLTGKSLELYMYRNTPGWVYGTNDIELYKEERVVNDDGYAIFNIKIAKDWKKESTKDSYLAIVTEKGDDVWKTGEFLKLNSTAKNKFEINRNLQFLRLTDQSDNTDNDSKTITTVNQVTGSNKTNCPRCKKFTEENFKQIFPKVTSLFQQGTNQLKSTSIKDFADALDRAFNEFNIDNCNRKIHFLTQITCETGNFARIDENLNYSKAGLIKTRSSLWLEKDYPKLYASDFEAKYVNKPEDLANYVYRNKGGNGDEASGDGYKYRGRGLIQLTFKSNYKLFEDYLVKKGEVEENAIIENPDLLLSNIDYLVRSAAWFWKYGKSGNGTDRLDINKSADRGDITKITLWTHGGTSTVPQRAKKYDELKKFYDLGLCNFFMNYLAKDYAIDYHIKPNTIEKHIPKGKTQNEIFQYRYYYHDEVGTEYFLCAVMGYMTQKWVKGTKITQSGKDWVKVTADNATRYYQKDGNNKCLLITVSPTLKVSGLFSYTENTSRRCANIDAYAVMLAAIADTRYTDFYFNGFTDYAGQGHPSVSHVNGINLDIRYLKTKDPQLPIYINTKGGWDILDLDRHNIFMKKAYERGFKQFFIMPLKKPFPGDTKSGWSQMCESLATTLNKSVSDIENKIYLYGEPHEHHVHLQKLSTENITTIEKQ